MGLKLFLMQCLRRLWKQSESSTHTEPQESISPSLPDEIGGDEYIARFVFDKRHLFKAERAGQPRPAAFKPELYEECWELSVCRNTGLQEARIWEIGRTCRPDKKALARADVGMAAVHDLKLVARYAPGSYPEHSVVLGWATSGDKDAHMMQMVELASAATGRLAPQTPPDAGQTPPTSALGQ